MGTFRKYSEISILNPQMRYFQKKCELPFFQKWPFWRGWPRKLSLNKIGVMDIGGKSNLVWWALGRGPPSKLVNIVNFEAKMVWNASHWAKPIFRVPFLNFGYHHKKCQISKIRFYASHQASFLELRHWKWLKSWFCNNLLNF